MIIAVTHNKRTINHCCGIVKKTTDLAAKTINFTFSVRKGWLTLNRVTITEITEMVLKDVGDVEISKYMFQSIT